MGEAPAGVLHKGNEYCVYRNSKWMKLNPQTLQVGGRDAQLMVVRGGRLILLQYEEAQHILSTGDGLECEPIDEVETYLHRPKKNKKRCKKSEPRILPLLQEMTSHVTLLTKLMMRERLMQPTAAIREITFKDTSIRPEETKLPRTPNREEVDLQSKNSSSQPESGKKPHIVISPKTLQAISKFSNKHLSIIKYKGRNSVCPGTFDNDDDYCQALLRHLNPLVDMQRSKFTEVMQDRNTKENFASMLGLVTVQKKRLMSCILDQRRKRPRKQKVYREVTTTQSEETSEYCQGNGNHNTYASSEESKQIPSENNLKPFKQYGNMHYAKLESTGSTDEIAAQPMTKVSQKTHPSMAKKSTRSSDVALKKRQKSISEQVKKASKRVAIISSDSSDTEQGDGIITATENVKMRLQEKYIPPHMKVKVTEGNKENRTTRHNGRKIDGKERTSPINTDSSPYRKKLGFEQSKPIKDRVFRSANSTINDSKNSTKYEPEFEKIYGKEATLQTTKSSKRTVRILSDKSETDYNDYDYSESTDASVVVGNSSKLRTYNTEEDHVILKHVLYSANYKLVKGASLWKNLESNYPSSEYCHRTWQSLKNRYLRNILPNLDKYDLSLDKQKLLRAGAYAGEIKKKNKNISLLKMRPVVSASKYMLMKRREEAKKQDHTVLESPSKTGSARRTRQSGTSSTTSTSRRGPTSSTPVHTPHKPTPTYSQLTRRFASRKREEASSSVVSNSKSSPTKSSPGKRKLFSSKM